MPDNGGAPDLRISRIALGPDGTTPAGSWRSGRRVLFDDPETLAWAELYQDRPFEEMRFYQTALDYDRAAELQQHGIRAAAS
jgi:hypothetical protein